MHSLRRAYPDSIHKDSLGIEYATPPFQRVCSLIIRCLAQRSGVPIKMSSTADTESALNPLASRAQAIQSSASQPTLPTTQSESKVQEKYLTKISKIIKKLEDWEAQYSVRLDEFAHAKPDSEEAYHWSEGEPPATQLQFALKQLLLRAHRHLTNSPPMCCQKAGITRLNAIMELPSKLSQIQPRLLVHRIEKLRAWLITARSTLEGEQTHLLRQTYPSSGLRRKVRVRFKE